MKIKKKMGGSGGDWVTGGGLGRGVGSGGGGSGWM